MFIRWLLFPPPDLITVNDGNSSEPRPKISLSDL